MRNSKTDQFFSIESHGDHDVITPLVHDTNDGTRALILSDVHIPYHNVDALREAIETGLDADVDVVILNGDFLDFTRISSYQQRAGKPSWYSEIKMGRQFLEMIREQFPDAKIYATGGNHQDERLERYLANRAPEMLEVEELKLENLLKYDELDIEDYSGSMMWFGDAIIGHGDEFRGVSGKNPAEKALKHLPDANCVIVGHLHRGESHWERSKTGRERHAHVSGHLGEMSPDYMGQAANQWRVGFIIAEIEGDGSTRVDHWIEQRPGHWANVSPVQTSIQYS